MDVDALQKYFMTSVEFKRDQFGIVFEDQVSNELDGMARNGAMELTRYYGHFVSPWMVSDLHREWDRFLDKLVGEAMVQAGYPRALGWMHGPKLPPFGMSSSSGIVVDITVFGRVRSIFCPGFWPFC